MSMLTVGGELPVLFGLICKEHSHTVDRITKNKESLCSSVSNFFLFFFLKKKKKKKNVFSKHNMTSKTEGKIISNILTVSSLFNEWASGTSGWFGEIRSFFSPK